jgi:uncharacterized protein YacL
MPVKTAIIHVVTVLAYVSAGLLVVTAIAILQLQPLVSLAFEFLVKIAAVAAPIILAYIAYRQHVADLAAREVKATLADATNRTDVKLDVIHKLVNAAMTEQLRINADQAARIARDHPMDEGAKAAALAAAKLYHDHLAGQKRQHERSG